MSNRIKDIFSNDKFNMSANFRFKDEDAYKSFLAALDSVGEEGCTVSVDGIHSISTEIDLRGRKYPVKELTDISNLTIGPSFEPFPIPLQIGETEQSVIFWRNTAKNKTVIKTTDNSVVYFEFSLFPLENRHTINYKIQFDKAKNIKEVADSYCIAYALLEKLYDYEASQLDDPDDKSIISIIDVKNYFKFHMSFLKRLLTVEEDLNLSISPHLLKNISAEQQQDIDEIYLLLIQHKKFRLNAKLTSTESTSITFNEESSSPVIGTEIEMAFSGTIDYDFLGQSVRLYTANLLSNAIAKEIQEQADGKIKLFYGDTDSKPMYISFSAFKTEEEASAELKTIMTHKEDYQGAPTSSSYIKQFYSIS